MDEVTDRFLLDKWMTGAEGRISSDHQTHMLVYTHILVFKKLFLRQRL